jgi:phosphoglycerate dehydrogenase-like enzyme
MKALVTSDWVLRYVDELRAEFPSVEFVREVSADIEVVIGNVDDEVLETAQRLKWIQALSAGVEWLRHVPALADTDIMVTNARGAHAATIAEHAIGMLVFLARRFDTLYRAQQERVWLQPAPTGTVGLSGLTMGVIGLGHIGRAIAVRAHGFAMKVIAVDAHELPKPDYVAELRLLDGLHDLLRRADVVAVAAPITNATRGMLGPEELALLQSGAYLLVMSRGGIVDEPTLGRMLRDGSLAGAGLDVTAVEPLPADSELWDAPNIIITPHSSPVSAQTNAAVTAILRRNLSHYLAGEPLENVVDKKLGY